MAGLSLASAPALLPTSIFSLRRSHLSPGVCAPRRTPGARRMGSRLWRVLSPSVQVLSHLRSGHIKAPSSVMTDGRSHGKAWSLGHRLTDETAATGIQPPGWGGAGGVQRGGVCCPPPAPPPGGSQNLPHPRPPHALIPHKHRGHFTPSYRGGTEAPTQVTRPRSARRDLVFALRAAPGCLLELSAGGPGCVDSVPPQPSSQPRLGTTRPGSPRNSLGHKRQSIKINNSNCLEAPFVPDAFCSPQMVVLLVVNERLGALGFRLPECAFFPALVPEPSSQRLGCQLFHGTVAVLHTDVARCVLGSAALPPPRETWVGGGGF